MFKGKVTKSVMLVPQGEQRPLKLNVEQWDDCTSISVPTEDGEYGGPEDVRSLKLVEEYGAFIAKYGLPHEKMYRKRLQDIDAGGRVVDRIRVEVSEVRWSDLEADGSLQRMKSEASMGVRAIMAWLLPPSLSD